MTTRHTYREIFREQEWIMRPRAIKYHECPRCHNKQAHLLMDIREKKPQRDEMQNLLYYCTQCDHLFAVDANGHVVKKK
jgi:DNA-directed RNA polymerase subunit M/transcription elongation factor TFIIS